MNYHGECEHCGGDVYAGGEDQGWVCTDCGCVWRLDGVLLTRDQDCPARRSPAAER